MWYVGSRSCRTSRWGSHPHSGGDGRAALYRGTSINVHTSKVCIRDEGVVQRTGKRGGRRRNKSNTWNMMGQPKDILVTMQKLKWPPSQAHFWWACDSSQGILQAITWTQINLCCKEVQDDLLTLVSNTMADRCVTNSAVDNLIEEEMGQFILSNVACNILMLSHIKPTQFWRKRTTENQLHIKGSMPHKKAGRAIHRLF